MSTVREDKLGQVSKNLNPMYFTLAGIYNDCNALQPTKVPSSMLSMPFGMIVPLQPCIIVLVTDTMIALQLLRESKIGLAESIIIDVNLSQK